MAKEPGKHLILKSKIIKEMIRKKKIMKQKKNNNNDGGRDIKKTKKIKTTEEIITADMSRYYAKYNGKSKLKEEESIAKIINELFTLNIKPLKNLKKEENIEQDPQININESKNDELPFRNTNPHVISHYVRSIMLNDLITRNIFKTIDCEGTTQTNRCLIGINDGRLVETGLIRHMILCRIDGADITRVEQTKMLINNYNKKIAMSFSHKQLLEINKIQNEQEQMQKKKEFIQENLKQPYIYSHDGTIDEVLQHIQQLKDDRDQAQQYLKTISKKLKADKDANTKNITVKEKESNDQVQKIKTIKDQCRFKASLNKTTKELQEIVDKNTKEVDLFNSNEHKDMSENTLQQHQKENEDKLAFNRMCGDFIAELQKNKMTEQYDKEVEKLHQLQQEIVDLYKKNENIDNDKEGTKALEDFEVADEIYKAAKFPLNSTYNLTDVIYYLTIDTLYKMTEDLKEGVVIIGNVHIPKYLDMEDHIIQFGDRIEGKYRITPTNVNEAREYYELHECKISMQMLGNDTIYNHPLQYMEFIPVQGTRIITPRKKYEYLLKVSTISQVDCGATHYVSFTITKIENPKNSDYMIDTVFNYNIIQKIPYNLTLIDRYIDANSIEDERCNLRKYNKKQRLNDEDIYKIAKMHAQIDANALCLRKNKPYYNYINDPYYNNYQERIQKWCKNTSKIIATKFKNTKIWIKKIFKCFKTMPKPNTYQDIRNENKNDIINITNNTNSTISEISDSSRHINILDTINAIQEEKNDNEEMPEFYVVIYKKNDHLYQIGDDTIKIDDYIKKIKLIADTSINMRVDKKNQEEEEEEEESDDEYDDFGDPKLTYEENKEYQRLLLKYEYIKTLNPSQSIQNNYSIIYKERKMKAELELQQKNLRESQVKELKEKLQPKNILASTMKMHNEKQQFRYKDGNYYLVKTKYNTFRRNYLYIKAPYLETLEEVEEAVDASLKSKLVAKILMMGSITRDTIGTLVQFIARESPDKDVITYVLPLIATVLKNSLEAEKKILYMSESQIVWTINQLKDNKFELKEVPKSTKVEIILNTLTRMIGAKPTYKKELLPDINDIGKKYNEYDNKQKKKQKNF
jgi:hypothetical protein